MLGLREQVNILVQQRITGEGGGGDIRRAADPN